MDPRRDQILRRLDAGLPVPVPMLRQLAGSDDEFNALRTAAVDPAALRRLVDQPEPAASDPESPQATLLAAVDAVQTEVTQRLDELRQQILGTSPAPTPGGGGGD